MPEPQLPTIWAITSGAVEVAEGGVPVGAEVTLAPDEIAYIIQHIALHTFSARKLTPPKSGWQGPRSLMLQLEINQSKPASAGAHLVGQLIANFLAPERLQFLQPPAKVAEILRQVVCRVVESTVEVDVAADVALGRDERDALLNNGDVTTALEIARDKPELLEATHRRLLGRAFPFLSLRNPAAIPIPFEVPFDGYAATERGDLNSLHSFGLKFCQALGAIALSERSGVVRPRQVAKLHEGCVQHVFGGNEIAVRFNVLLFAARAFEFVIDRNLLKEFTAPPNLRPAQIVPPMSRGFTMAEISVRGRYIPDETLGKFGELITQWPLQQGA